MGTVWTRTVGPAGAEDRVVPDGCMDVILHEDSVRGSVLLVAGPDTVAHPGVSVPGARYLGLRFRPGVGPAVLGVPADELRDLRLDLDDLWPRAEVERLREAAATGGGDALELTAAARLRAGPGADPGAPAIAAAALAGRSVGDTATALGMSERHLHRRCLRTFGYGPKLLARILRFDRALALARGGTPFAVVAARAGYADQAHLSRDVRALAGVPLGTVVAG